MGLFGAIGGLVNQATGGEAGRLFGRLSNQTEADASVAALAMVTMGDGEAEDEEIDVAIEYIQSNPAFRSFNTGKLVEKYEAHIEAMQANPRFGHAGPLGEFARLKGKPAARQVLDAVVELAGADAEGVEPGEVKAIKRLAAAVGLSTTEYGF